MSPIQWCILVVVIIVLVIEITWMIKARSRRWLGLPTAIWMIASLAYYVAVYLKLEIDTHNLSQSLRLLGYMSVMAMGAYRLWRLRDDSI